MELAAALDLTAAAHAAVAGRKSFEEGGFMIFQEPRKCGTPALQGLSLGLCVCVCVLCFFLRGWPVLISDDGRGSERIW